VKQSGYRVDHIVPDTGHFAPYTAPKRPVSFEMATAYANHLERGQCGGRIVDFATGEIVREWEGKYPRVPLP